MTKPKTTSVEIRIPNRTQMALEEIAALAGTSEANVIKTMLSLYAGAWISTHEPPKKP